MACPTAAVIFQAKRAPNAVITSCFFLPPPLYQMGVVGKDPMALHCTPSNEVPAGSATLMLESLGQWNRFVDN